MSRIYLDHNATTPVAAEVADRMDRAVAISGATRRACTTSASRPRPLSTRPAAQVAALLGGEAAEIIFTAGGTESDNFAIRGAAEALEPTGRRHLIATRIEHEAVLKTLAALAKRGWRVTLLSVDASGIVSPEALRDAITDDTALVSVMHANNEIGTVQPLAELAQIAKAHGALVHTDAVQSAGKIPIDVRALGVDMLVDLWRISFMDPRGRGPCGCERACACCRS